MEEEEIKKIAEIREILKGRLKISRLNLNGSVRS